MTFLVCKGSTLRRFVGLGGLMAVVIAAGFTFAGDQAGAKSKAEPESAATPPALYAVRMHADWCAACGKLDPAYSKLIRESGELPVLFVTLDMTDQITRRQAAYLASSLGLGQLWAKQRNKVGNIVFVDAADKGTVSSVPASGDVKVLRAALRQAVNSVATSEAG